ncbi:MAG: Ig-like domain-containing protein [Holophagaceae bacterium]|nr:Ig-like domain-containing protein [Holophagaceae bacterium]
MNRLSPRPEPILYALASALTIAALSLCAIACSSEDRGRDRTIVIDNVPVWGVSLEPAFTLEKGASKTISANVQPSNASNKSLEWKCEPAGIATVNASGLATALVTAVNVGKATITVTTKDGGKTDTCEVTVTEATPPPPEPDVYIAGYVTNGQGFDIATLWKNRSALPLSSQSTRNSQANSAFAFGDYVYVAGYENNSQGRSVAMLWKIDGVSGLIESNELTDGARDAKANAVFVNGDGVYVAGYERSYTRNREEEATLWTDGVSKSLGNTDFNRYGRSNANAVFVSGSYVYVAGYEINYSQGQDREVATLWTNGVSKPLGNSNSGQYGKSFANAILASGTDVYVVGNEFSHSQYRAVATLWKNNERAEQIGTATSGNSDAQSIVGSGGDVYVAGHEYSRAIETATLWKNGLGSPLSDTWSQAYQAQSHDGDMYVLGVVAGTVTLWKNGRELYSIGNATAKSVFVK